jgi:TRAP-type C4-dicarboxylate transport system substrate-binding protein
MRTTVFLSFAIVLLMALLVACGESATPVPPTSTPAPTAEPTAVPTEAPTEATEEEPTAVMEEEDELKAYAAEHAGGPGAIYIGDGNFDVLVGPSVYPEFMDLDGTDLGDDDGQVPLDAIMDVRWVFESDYYRQLIETANLTNPTQLTSSGENIELQHTCINSQLLWCKHQKTYFVPNVEARTEGQVTINVTSFPELGLAGPDTLSLVTDGTLDSATIYGGYVGGEMPPIEIQNLWGIYNSREQEFEATQAVIKDIEELVLSETGGVIMNHNWYAGNDQFFFCREKIESLDDFEGKKTRSHSAALSDWINGMGADAQFLAFAEVYTAIERGILDCGVTGADAGYGQRWYEVTDYLVGPLVSFPSNNNVINGTKWAEIPEDLQQIILEEAAKSELEALRISAIQNEMGQIKNTTERGAGQDAMEFVPFSDEMNFRSLNTAVMEHVVPAWVNRVGNTSHPIIADTFNNKVGPIVGLRIEADGTVVKIN